MFYATNEEHGLRHNPFKALIVPRPIAWMSTLSANGTPNLAPFSFFNAIADRPPMLAVSFASRVNTLVNLEETGECTCNFVSKPMVDAMNMSSAAVADTVNEFDLSKIDSVASTMVKPARVALSPSALECTLWKTIDLPALPEQTQGYTMALLNVIGVHIKDEYIKEGMVDTVAMQAVSRLGYMDYATVSADSLFTLNRPAVSEDGLEATLNTGEWDGVYR